MDQRPLLDCKITLLGFILIQTKNVKGVEERKCSPAIMLDSRNLGYIYDYLLPRVGMYVLDNSFYILYLNIDHF